MNSDRTSAVVGLIVSFLILFLGLRGLPLGTLGKPGSGFFPVILGSLLGILCLILLVKSAGERPVSQEEKRGSLVGKKRVAMTFGALLIYTVLLEPLGFLLCTFLIMIFMLKLVGRKGWRYALGWSLVVTVAAYAVFQMVLQAQLPSGILGL